MGKCGVRWETRISCDEPPSHVGVHINRRTGLCWWGRVLFDPVPGSLADTDVDSGMPEPQILPYPPVFGTPTATGW